MPRGKNAPKRVIAAEPKFGSVLLAKFINMIMKNGKKTIAQDIVYSALDKIAEIKKLPAEPPMYRSYYLLRRIGGRRLTNTFLEGIDIAGRTALVYSQNDIIGAWAKDRFGNYLRECLPGGQPQRFEAQKLTLNLIMYGVTGTYKSDAIHQQHIREKLQR